MNPVIIGNATLYLGDCREILPTLPKVDAVITDPPYGIGADKKAAHSSIRDNKEWDSFGWDSERPEREIFELILAASKEVAIWGGNYFADWLPASGAYLIWRKPTAESGFSMSDAELCWTNLGFSPRMKTFNKRDGNEHPTQKPVALMEWCMDYLKGKTVLDPFMGSGTTGVACMNLGKSFIGIERELKYFDIACRRIDDAQRQQRMFT